MNRYNRRRKEKKTFWWFYLGLMLVLIAFICVCVMTVKDLLVEYESRQPEEQVKTVIAQLAEKSKSPDEFCDYYEIAVPEAGEYEAGLDIADDFIALFAEEQTDYAIKPGSVSEDETVYLIRNGELTLAEVTLKAAGPLETKLVVFSMRDWEVGSVKICLEPKDYSLTLPEEFSVSLNGIALEKTETVEGKCKYNVTGLYLEPQFLITDPFGERAEYYISADGRVLADIYDYDLVLPKTLSVTVNGNTEAGSERDDGLVAYDITELKKPEVTVSDLYGNTVNYEGGSIPLTATTILVKEGCSVTVDSVEPPKEAIFEALSPEYSFLEGIVEGLPSEKEYSIAVLKKDAVISVRDSAGTELAIDVTKSYNDLTITAKGSDTIPEEISDSIDVLEVAKSWSLFMSNDLTFNQLSAYLLKDSYQYEVAYKYSTGVDKTFFSGHSLMNPPFTDTSAGNFVMITEDSFSVDISLTKHMLLNSNQKVDDSMNDRFYFVKSNGKWLLVGMKEVTDNAQ